MLVSAQSAALPLLTTPPLHLTMEWLWSAATGGRGEYEQDGKEWIDQGKNEEREKRKRRKNTNRKKKAEGIPGENQKRKIMDYDNQNIQLFERLMTVEELADAFGLAPQTIRNWVALRQIPFISIGGKTRFRKRSIEAWLERKEFKLCP